MFERLRREFREPYTPRPTGCPLDIMIIASLVCKARGGHLLFIFAILLASIISMVWSWDWHLVTPIKY